MRVGAWWTLVVVVVALGCKGSQPSQGEARSRTETSPGTRSMSPQEAIEAAERAEAESKQAQAEAERAARDAQVAQAALDSITKDLEALDGKVAKAVTAVAEAQNAADQAAAKAQLVALQKEHAELEGRVAAARADMAKAERRRGVKISKECLDNPLAKGCL